MLNITHVKQSNTGTILDNCFTEEWILFIIMAQLLSSMALDQYDKLLDANG
jgi:hypothetical protein